MTNLERAIKDGYAYITETDNKQRITYVSSDNHTENYNDPEEKVRAEFWAELIYKYEYPANRIKVEVVIPDRLPTDRADIVVFIDDECKRPYTVVECKKDGVTDAEFTQAIEQGVDYFNYWHDFASKHLYGIEINDEIARVAIFILVFQHLCRWTVSASTHKKKGLENMRIFKI